MTHLSGLKRINGILKRQDCPHCGTELEYQCGECEKEEKEYINQLFKIFNNINEWEYQCFERQDCPHCGIDNH